MCIYSWKNPTKTFFLYFAVTVHLKARGLNILVSNVRTLKSSYSAFREASWSLTQKNCTGTLKSDIGPSYTEQEYTTQNYYKLKDINKRLYIHKYTYTVRTFIEIPPVFATNHYNAFQISFWAEQNILSSTAKQYRINPSEYKNSFVKNANIKYILWITFSLLVKSTDKAPACTHYKHFFT